MPLLVWYEKKLKFISKDSLVNVCLWGDDYTTASQKGFFLAKLRHKDEGYSVLNFVKFVLFSSKCAISILAGIFVYAYCVTQQYSPSTFDITIMDSPMVPYAFTFITCLFFTSVSIGNCRSTDFSRPSSSPSTWPSELCFSATP